MKSKNVLLIALMAMSVSVMASNVPFDSKVTVVSQKAGIFKVIYEGSKAGKVTIKITDKNGSVVFSETLKTVNGFIRPVNFEGMEPGAYAISISDENGEQIRTVNYQNEKATTNAHISKISEEGKYLLGVTNEGTEQINVKIYDGENNLVHNEDLTVNGSFGLVYNLKQVAGTPSFEITDKSGKSLIVK